MILPLKDWNKLGYRFSEKTFYSSHHFGVDFIIPTGTPVFAPETGKANYFLGSQAGKAIYLRVNASRIHRLMHLNSRLVYDGKMVAEGELLGYSGNTGLCKGFCLHWDIWNGIKPLNIECFIDPYGEFINLNNQNTMPNPEISGGECQKLVFALLGDKWTKVQAEAKVNSPNFKVSDFITELLQLVRDGVNVSEKHFEKVENGFECLQSCLGKFDELNECKTKLKSQEDDIKRLETNVCFIKKKLDDIKQILES